MPERASGSAAEAAHAEYFESLERQKLAARVAMWVFLGSEVLLFAALFSLYASYRAEYPAVFSEAVTHSKKLLGSAMTVILLISSFMVARAVHALRDGSRRLAAWLTTGAVGIGAIFLAMKFYEYASHIQHGILLGGRGHFFEEHAATGFPLFFNLYYISTGTHALHVTVGMGVLAFLAWRIFRGHIDAPHAHKLEVGALYWHLVDAIWIVLWPLYYLTGGGG